MLTSTLILSIILVLIIIYVLCKSTKDELIIYRFYSPGCIYCIQSQPEWDNFVRNNAALNIQELNMSRPTKESKNLVKKFKVPGWPTIIVSKGSMYLNPNTATELISCINLLNSIKYT